MKSVPRSQQRVSLNALGIRSNVRKSANKCSKKRWYDRTDGWTDKVNILQGWKRENIGKLNGQVARVRILGADLEIVNKYGNSKWF